MNLDTIPSWLLFVITTILVALAIELGYRLGDSVHRRSEDEKESPVSAISATVLGLLAFILAFTFAIVSDRYDARKGLVREEAQAIRTAYARSEFLPEPDRSEAKVLLKDYVDTRVAALQSGDLALIEASMADADRIQRRLWDMAVTNARKDMNSDVAALYIEAVNDVTNVHALRVSMGLQVRIPPAIWLVLLALILLAMAGVGYQTAIAGSRRTWAMLILALSFSLVIVMIAELDRPQSGHFAVSQQPLVNLQEWMVAGEQGP